MSDDILFNGANLFAGMSSCLFVFLCGRDLFKSFLATRNRFLIILKWLALDLIAMNLTILIVGYNLCNFMDVDSSGCGGFAGFGLFYFFPTKILIWVIVSIPLRLFRKELFKQSERSEIKLKT